MNLSTRARNALRMMVALARAIHGDGARVSLADISLEALSRLEGGAVVSRSTGDADQGCPVSPISFA